MNVRDDAARRSGDHALEDRLGKALAAADPAPPALAQTAYELFTWRTVDAELAELLRAPAAAE